MACRRFFWPVSLLVLVSVNGCATAAAPPPSAGPGFLVDTHSQFDEGSKCPSGKLKIYSDGDSLMLPAVVALPKCSGPVAADGSFDFKCGDIRTSRQLAGQITGNNIKGTLRWQVNRAAGGDAQTCIQSFEG